MKLSSYFCCFRFLFIFRILIDSCNFIIIKAYYISVTTRLLDDWLTVQHRSITLVDLQLDAQNSYLFTYNTFIKILYMFRALPCSSSGGLRRNYIHVASGIVSEEFCPNFIIINFHLQTKQQIIIQ
jgi:hypothetical protein